MASRSLGATLVVGGCGFLGYETVCLFSKEPNCSVSVLSREPREVREEGVCYYAYDIANIDQLLKTVSEINRTSS